MGNGLGNHFHTHLIEASMNSKKKRSRIERYGVSFVITTEREVATEIENSQVEQEDFREYMGKYPLALGFGKTLKKYVIPCVCFFAAILGIYQFFSGS